MAACPSENERHVSLESFRISPLTLDSCSAGVKLQHCKTGGSKLDLLVFMSFKQLLEIREQVNKAMDELLIKMADQDDLRLRSSQGWPSGHWEEEEDEWFTDRNEGEDGWSEILGKKEDAE